MKINGFDKSYLNVPGLCNATSLNEIKARGFSLNPGRYVGATEKNVVDEDFLEKLEELQEEFVQLTGEARFLEDKISMNYSGLIGTP